MFPNAVSMRPAAGPDETPLPWFNIVALIVLFGSITLAVLRVRRWRMRRAGAPE